MRWLVALVCGALVLVVAARLRPRPAPRVRSARSPRSALMERSVRCVGAGVVAALSYRTFGLTGVVLLAGASATLPRLARRRQRLREIRAADGALPELIELFVVAASAGLPVATAMAAVAERAPPPVRLPVSNASHRFERGIPLVECLSQLGAELGPPGEPLVAALAESVISGAPLAARLGAVADRARDSRRQRALEGARRLPVTMLFPLVGCILPAAIVLAVVPVVLVSFSALAP